MRRIKRHMQRLKYPVRSESEYEQRLNEQQKRRYLEKEKRQNRNNNRSTVRRSHRIKSQKIEANSDVSDNAKHQRTESRTRSSKVKTTKANKSIKKRKKKASKHRSRWTKYEEQKLMRLFNSDKSTEHIAKQLNRTESAIIARLNKLNAFNTDNKQRQKSEAYQPWTISYVAPLCWI